MNIDLDKTLCEKYPDIYCNRHGNPQETLMCWGFECGDGWFNILDQLSFQIQHHLDYNNRRRERLLRDNPYSFGIPEAIPQVVAVQVKEKFGTLRFYYDGGDEYVSGMVSMAESMTSVTCETCGAPGKTRGGPWVYTACDEHTKPNDLYSVKEPQ